VAYELRAITNFRIHPKTKKPQYLVSWKPIKKRNYKDRWVNGSMVSAATMIRSI